MSLAVVQHNSAIHTSQIPGSVTITTTPTVGNLLIAALGVNEATTSYTVGTGWTRFDAVSQFEQITSTNMVLVYRYVQAGDTTTLPAFMSAGTTYWTHAVYEISGVTGSWDADFLMGWGMVSLASNLPIAQMPVFASGSIALTFTASYNGSTNPSITGSWTLDETHNNNGNFGSAASASRSMASTDTLDGTWTQGTSSPLCGYVLVLTPTVPGYMWPKRIYSSSNVPLNAAIDTSWTPTIGNLWTAYLGWGNGTQGNPTFTASWTNFKDVTLTTKSMIALSHYVSSTDVSNKQFPALISAGSGFYELTIIEWSGASGTFGTDNPSNKSGAQNSGATLTTTADTTTAVNQWGVLSFGNYNSGVRDTATGFVTGNMKDGLDGTNYGAWIVSMKRFTSAGGTVQGIVTPGATTQPQSYIQSIFGGAATVETGTARMTFGGLAIVGVATDAQVSAAVMHFGPLAFHAAGSVTLPSGVGAMHFVGLSLKALGADTGASPSPVNPAIAQNNIPAIQPLTWNVPIVDAKTGNPTPELQRKWLRTLNNLQKQITINDTIIPKSYIDQQDTNTLAGAQTYTNSQSAVTLSSAQAYTDSRLLSNCTVAALPASPAHGTRGYVTDAIGPTFGSNVVGGGGVESTVYFDGTWKVG